MTGEQTTLRFEQSHQSDREIATLIAYLRGQGWKTAKQTSEALGWDDRAVRALAAASDEVISYPGSPGYKLLEDCSLEEYERYRLARRHQAREMISKVIRTDRRFYRRPAMTL
jgi:hypothetical protein